jgi:hypothetical protein
LSLEDIPQTFADAVGINLATAQVILSITIIFALLLPTMLLARGKNATTIYLVMLLLAECLLVGLEWMPFWILIATVAMMALAIASLGTGVVTGE